MSELESTGLIAVKWNCQACGEENETEFDPTGGEQQSMTEDCSVCCRPNLLRFVYDTTTGQVAVTAELEQW